jgi:hypothetical protein
VFLPDTPIGGGVTNFFFSGSAALVPGTSYFFEIVVQSGDLWRVNLGGTYSSGAAYFQGVPQSFDSLWFREGIVIPEPSSAWLVFLVGGIWFVRSRKRNLHLCRTDANGAGKLTKTQQQSRGLG